MDMTNNSAFNTQLIGSFASGITILTSLSGKPVKISEIRTDELNPGITEYEMRLFKLIEIITNGSLIDINVTGTQVRFTPGIITNNNGEEFVFSSEGMETQDRCLTYYLEFLLPVVIFGKRTFNAEFIGITNDNIDLSIDSFKNCLVPVLKHFGIEGIEIEIKKRGLYPLGGGSVSIQIPIVKKLESVSLIEEGKIKKIRGIAYSCNVNPTLATRMIDSIRNVFNDYLPDVWIYCDHYKKDKAGLSKGYGVSLVAETTTECLICIDQIYNIGDVSDPEKLGESAAMKLLDEIYYSGYTDIKFAPTILLLMALSDLENMSEIKLSRNAINSDNLIRTLRNLHTFFGIRFKINECEDSKRDGEEEDKDSENEDNKVEEIDPQQEEVETVAELVQKAEHYIFTCVGNSRVLFKLIL